MLIVYLKVKCGCNDIFKYYTYISYSLVLLNLKSFFFQNLNVYILNLNGSHRFLLKKYCSQKLFACFNLKGDEMDFGKIASVVLIFMGKLSDVTQNTYAVC